jgi:hypothetical protein
VTTRAHSGGTTPRAYAYFDGFLVVGELGRLVDEPWETMALVCSENNYPHASGFLAFALLGRPGLAATPSAEILFGPVDTPSWPRQRR